MRYAQSGAKDGATILIIGVIIGLFLAFILHEYGNREATKAAFSVNPNPPNPTPPESYWDGKNYIAGSAS